MSVEEILGYILASGVGMLMGLLGSGGSLVVPLMVFVFGKDEVSATAYALFIVGFTASSGMVAKIRGREVDFSTALTFVIPISIGTYLGRVLIHSFPEILLSIGDIDISRRQVVLTIYAIMLILSFSSMMGLWGKNLQVRSGLRKVNPLFYYSLISVLGLVIGMLSGITGAGGGILIVPVIVILMGIDMKLAVGTSLAIQVCKSFVGFAKDWSVMGTSVEWNFIFGVTAMMVGGILVGSRLSRFIPSSGLKTSYGWFVLGMAIFILTKEFFL